MAGGYDPRDACKNGPRNGRSQRQRSYCYASVTTSQLNTLGSRPTYFCFQVKEKSEEIKDAKTKNIPYVGVGAATLGIIAGTALFMARKGGKLF